MVTGVFVVAGAVWVLLTDIVFYLVVRDPVLIGRLETAKGWSFVALAALVIFVATSYAFSKTRRSETLLKAILNSISDGVMLVGGPTRGVVDANPAVLRILGVTREDLVGLVPKTFAEKFHLTRTNGEVVGPDDYASQKALDGETTAPYTAILRRNATAQPVYINVATAPVNACSPETRLAVSVMRDVTELELLEKAKEDFFAAAAHSLKTPFATIRVHAELLHLGAQPGSQTEASLSVIDRQCDRMDRIIQALLILARSRTGDVQYLMEPLELADLVATVAREMQSLHGDFVHVRIEARPLVIADRERITLAIAGMVDAAIRTRADGAPLTIALTTHDGRARVSVTCAVRPDFAGLRREDEAAVALHVARLIVEAHRGTHHLRIPERQAENTSWFELTVRERGHARADE